MKKKKTQNAFLNKNRGFTLVELMIAVFLTGIAVIAIYRGYVSFSKSSDVQEQLIEMQQNLRIGMWMLEKDLRRAGMNEENDENAGFSLAAAQTIMFTMDLGGTNRNNSLELTDLSTSDEGDGDVDDIGEEISYTRRGPDANGAFGLYRNDENLNPGGTGNQIITNLEALDFVYLNESGSALDPLPLDPAGLDIKEIRSVQVSIVVRTTNEDYSYNNTEPYENIKPVEDGGPETIFQGGGDNFRRRVLSKQIKIRNAGL
jgi:type IV pilus assembly protein PilW